MEVLDKNGTTAIMLDNTSLVTDASAALNSVSDIRAEVVLRTTNGETTLPRELSNLVMEVLEGISRQDRVTISSLPAEISAPTAADLLGISRPTFLKWAASANLTVHKVGSQKRFLTSEVFEMRREHVRKQLEQFRELQEKMSKFDL